MTPPSGASCTAPRSSAIKPCSPPDTPEATEMTAPVVLRHPVPRAEWLGKLTEDILEPALPIIDPHHHLWDHPGSRYLLDELLADVNSGHNIVATVFIQCGSG